MRSSVKILFVFLSPLLFYFGCASSVPTIEKPKVYEEIPFKKIISPLFKDETSSKYVHFKAKFAYDWGANGTATVAEIYRRGYEVITLTDVEELTATTGFMCVVPYSLKDALILLKAGDIVEVWAYLHPTNVNPYIEVERFNKVLPN